MSNAFPVLREIAVDDRGALLRELMAVFDQLPAALREAINYAPEPLDPKALAALCRKHGAANVLAMIELKLKRQAETPPLTPLFRDGRKRGILALGRVPLPVGRAGFKPVGGR